MGGYSDLNPSWSADRDKIVLRSDRDGDDEIFAMNREGTSVKKLTDNSTFDGKPVWSPDGTEIVFSTERFGQIDIYKIKADGNGTPVNLTFYGEPDRAPSWGLVKE